MRDRLQALYIDTSKIDENTIESIKRLRVGYSAKKIVDVNLNDGVNEGKISKIISKDDKEEKEDKKKKILEKELSKYRERIKTTLSMIPVFMFMTPTRERIWEDIISTDYPDLFKEILGVYPVEMDAWLRQDIIVGGVPNFNRTLMFVADSIQDLEDDFTSENYDEFVTRHFAGLKGVNVKTPLVIIDRMIEMANIDFSNPNQKILDPCMGTGSYLLRLKELFMNGLSGVIKDRDEREEYIMTEILYGSDIDENKIKIAEKMLGGYNNVRVCASALELVEQEIFGDMKFDLIISNPPYNRGLDLRILDRVEDLG